MPFYFMAWSVTVVAFIGGILSILWSLRGMAESPQASVRNALLMLVGLVCILVGCWSLSQALHPPPGVKDIPLLWLGSK